MLTLCTTSVIEFTASVLSTTIRQKVALCIDKIKSDFNGTVNSLNYTAMLVSSTNNDT